MSESASTSSSDFSETVLFLLLSPFLVWGSGDAKLLRGVEPLPSLGVLCDGEVGRDPGA
jgi:hypothetical protein